MTVYIVDIEAVDTRYTGQWKTHVPTLFENAVVIEGPTNIPKATTPGAFLNFGGTNVYKARQVEQIARLFCGGEILPGDHFIFTDAWHPGIINLKYMSELLQIPVTIHALWHAGSYDPHDFLGRLIGNKPWVRKAEESFFDAIDHNYFATEFHIQLFAKTFGPDAAPTLWTDMHKKSGKIVRSGWPMEYMEATLTPWKGMKKRDLILFPHRIAPEKQVEIFRDLAARNPQYEWVVCQDHTLTKDQYHAMLGEAKIVFSASLQETLGIGCYEGCIVDALPLVPDRLSYAEMYSNVLRYPSEWTRDYDHYLEFRTNLEDRINAMMHNYTNWQKFCAPQTKMLTEKFFSATEILKRVGL
jgi:hypothetical protein